MRVRIIRTRRLTQVTEIQEEQETPTRREGRRTLFVPRVNEGTLRIYLYTRADETVVAAPLPPGQGWEVAIVQGKPIVVLRDDLGPDGKPQSFVSRPVQRIIYGEDGRPELVRTAGTEYRIEWLD